MKLLINSREIPAISPPPDSLGQALVAVESQHVADDHVIASVYIDGEPLSAEQLAQWKHLPLDNFTQADIQVIKRNIMAANALRIIAQGLNESRTEREKISDLLSQGHAGPALNLLTNYLQTWNTVQQSLAGAGRLLNVNLDTITINVFLSPDQSPQLYPLSDIFENLTQKLSDLKSALSAHDLVLLGDILEYEFSPLTDLWCLMLDDLAERFENQP